MLKSILKSWIPWIIVVLLFEIIMGLWQGDKIDWGTVVSLSLFGLIGVMIGVRLRGVTKKE